MTDILHISCHRSLCLRVVQDAYSCSGYFTKFTGTLVFFGFKGFEFVKIFMNPLDSIIFKIISFYSFSFNLGTSTSLGMARRMDKLDHWGYSEVRKRSPREITPKISQEYSDDISRRYRWSEPSQWRWSTSELWRYWKCNWKSYWATITFRKCVHISSNFNWLIAITIHFNGLMMRLSCIGYDTVWNQS